MARKNTTGTPEPMDPSIKENAIGQSMLNTQRDCYAIATLKTEVAALFPETAAESSDYDGRNTAMTVTFAFGSLSKTEKTVLGETLDSIQPDPRVLGVVTSEKGVAVRMKSDPRTQDDRATFRLNDVYSILTEGSV